MNFTRFESYAPVVLRFAMVILFLWFGFSQLTTPSDWTAWVPAWPMQLTGLSAETIVLLNGIFEVVLGIFLAAGFYTRLAALLLSLHLLLIAFEIGYNDIGMRDLVLAIATSSLVLFAPDRCTLDNHGRKE